jgi:predicted acyl esterase
VRRLLAVLAASVGALVVTAPASPFTQTQETVVMDDGVPLETTLYLPDGTPPEAGWPGIIMLHGLGSDRRTANVLAETFFVPHGYAVLTYDARGHFQSGGLVTIAGPREIADVRALESIFAARPDVDDAHIGGWGISYGGGQTWLAAAAGVPFSAIVTVESWTDLYSALFPGNLPKSGIVAGFINEIPQGKLDPQYSFIRLDAILGLHLDVLRQLGGERSVAAALPAMSVPTLMLQGRRDFAFDIDQAIRAYRQLQGPKRLYLGLHGHAPSTFPAADTEYAMTLARRWYDRFLKGEANGVDTEPNVEIAPDPWRPPRLPVAFTGLPPTRTLSYLLRGAQTIDAADRVTRTATTTTTPLETFGGGTVLVRATTTGGWSRLVALVTAVTPGGRTIVVTAGGVPTRAGTRTYSIPLISDVTVIPRGSRLEVTFASTTTGTAAGLLYLDLPMPGRARLTVRNASLRLPVLRAPISR